MRFGEFIGERIADGIMTIDRQCDLLINGIEGGLCNIKRQFAPLAVAELGKKLTEETLTSWLLSKHLVATELSMELERHYPASREECDLVLSDPDGRSFWIEVKNSWRHWFNCDGTFGRSSAYKGYLFGDESHPGLPHDFRKLERLTDRDATGVGVQLIGFESTRHLMEEDVKLMTRNEKLAERGWVLSHKESWPDRRNPHFRISTWFWTRSTK